MAMGNLASMRSRAVALAFVGCLLVQYGCQSKPPQPTLTGNWEGRLVGKAITPFEEKLYNGDGVLAFTLTIASDSVFTLKSGNYQIKGKLTSEESQLTASIDSYNGKVGADIPGEVRRSPHQFLLGGKPLKGNYDAKADKLTLVSDVTPDVTFEFVRAMPRRATGTTVTAGEQRLVGTYVSVLNKPDPGASATDPTELQLLEDNTYVMKLVVRSEGTWKLQKGQVLLIDKTAKGNEVDLTLNVTPNGDLVDARKDRFALPFRFTRR